MVAYNRAKRRADPAAYREKFRRLREDPDFLERQRKSQRASIRRNRAKVAARQRDWYRRNKHKARAQNAARRAVKAGNLEREPCLFCDEPKVEAHHHDYSEPLAVTWLCAKHHGLVHRIVEVPCTA